MQEKQYIAITSFFAKHRAARTLLLLASKGLPALVYLAYCGVGLMLLWEKDVHLWRFFLVPAVVFLFGTLLRALVNSPRPYEVFGIPPTLPKATKGKSFPSRHVFSAAVITLAFAYLDTRLGLVMGAVALAVAVTRVLSGAHWPRDVLAGLVFGGLLGYIGCFVL